MTISSLQNQFNQAQPPIKQHQETPSTTVLGESLTNCNITTNQVITPNLEPKFFEGGVYQDSDL